MPDRKVWNAALGYIGKKLDDLRSQPVKIDLGETTKSFNDAQKSLSVLAVQISQLADSMKRFSDSRVDNNLLKGILAEMVKQARAIERGLAWKDDTEAKKTNKRLEDVISAIKKIKLEEKKVDLSGIDDVRRAIEALDIKNDTSKLETLLNSILERLNKMELIVPKEVKIDPDQFRELSAVGRYGGMVNTGEFFTRIIDGSKDVTTAGTAVQLSATSQKVSKVDITAKLTNGGFVVVGSSTVVAVAATRRGTPLANGNTLTMHIDNLNKVYIDSETDGDGVTYSAYLQ